VFDAQPSEPSAIVQVFDSLLSRRLKTMQAGPTDKTTRMIPAASVVRGSPIAPIGDTLEQMFE
jgi:hypothetical protein